MVVPYVRKQSPDAVRSSLNEGLGGVAQKCGVASAVWAGPLAARRVKVTGEVVPGETVKLAQEFLRGGVLDVPKHP